MTEASGLLALEPVERMIAAPPLGGKPIPPLKPIAPVLPVFIRV
jgi:hypothetical protein